MRSGPILHGVLLAGALGFAWQTWTRDRAASPTTTTLTVWPGEATVESLSLHGALRDVTIEKRDGAYWGSVTKSTPPPPRPAAPDGGVADSVSVPEDKGTTTKTEFPVGEDGEKALGKLAPLRALRDLGTSTSKVDAGIRDDSERLTVKAGGATHELVLGDKVFGGDDRYVLDPAGGHIYVVAGDVLRAFDTPEFALRERKLHGFAPTDVAEVVLRAGGKERTLVRMAKAPLPDNPHGGPATSWADAKTPETADQTLANFMERVAQLAPGEFGQTPDAKSLTPVVTVEYRAKGGKVLGTAELSKKPAQAAGQFDYFVKSERTRGLASVNPLSAARVDQDLAQILP